MRSITPEMQLATGRLVALRGGRQRPGERKLGISVVTETYPPEINGVAHTVQRAVEFLAERGHGVQLVRPRQPGEPKAGRTLMVSEFLTRGMQLPMYPDARLGLASRSTLARLWSLATPDVVHIATEGPLGYSALAAARRLRIPTTSDFRTNFHLYTEHYRLRWSKPLALSYLRWFHNRSSLTFVPTARLAEELGSQGFANLRVVGRGVDSLLFSPARRSDALRSEWGATDESLVVLHVGRLAPEKNPALLLRAFDAIRAVNARARLVLVGDGPLRAELGAARPDVAVTGWHRDAALAECYASADLFLFPSRTETFGNVVLEALASGLPLLAFDRAAAGEHVRDGVNGHLVAADDEAAFVAAAARLGQRPDLARRVCAAARATALALDWGRILGGLERALGNVAMSRSPLGHGTDLAGAA